MKTKYRILEDGNGLFTIESFSPSLGMWFGTGITPDNIGHAMAEVDRLIRSQQTKVIYEVEV